MLYPQLIATLTEAKTELERHKKDLESFFSAKTIENACYAYTQSVLSTNPKIVMPTQEAIIFYRDLLKPGRLKEIVFEQQKLRYSKQLTYLVGQDIEKAKALLSKFHSSDITKYQPDTFSNYLDENGLFQKNNPKQSSKAKKTVRFA